MEDKRPYEIYKRLAHCGKVVSGGRFWTLGETVREICSRDLGWTYRFRKIKDPRRALQEMLDERGLPLRVWYRRTHPQGWMVGREDWEGEEGMSRIGNYYAQAVEFIRKGSLDWTKEKT